MTYKRDKEKKRKYEREYYALNIIKARKRAKEKYQRVKEYQKEWSRKKYQANKELYKERSKIYGKTIKARYGLLKRKTPKRGYDMLLTFEEFSEIVSKPCKYCGESKEIIGVDRMDNSVGYTVENSTPCCKICNMMKHAMELEKFLLHIQKIANHSQH